MKVFHVATGGSPVACSVQASRLHHEERDQVAGKVKSRFAL